MLCLGTGLSAQDVPESANDIRPLLIGSDLPESSLSTLEGEEVSIRELTKKNPTVIVFYRGGWCPYCNKQLAGLNDIQGQMDSLGFQVIAISPDNAAHLSKTADKEELAYTLLSDSKMELARKMGIAFKMDKKTLKKYKLFGIDLKEASGESHYQLPAPAVFVLDRKGVVQFSYVNPNYKVRLSPKVLLAVLEGIGD